MQHECLQCHQTVELPEGHRLIVCSLCGAAQDRFKPSKTPLPAQQPKAAQVPRKVRQESRGIRPWAIIAGVVAVVWFLAQLSAPSYNAYTQKIAQRTEPATTSKESDLQSATIALKELITYTDAFNREMQKMPYTAHVDLPALMQRMQAIMDDAAMMKLPFCASNVKHDMMISMTYGHGAVKLNHAAGQGINHPAVIEQIGNATRAVADAQIEMTKMKC